MQTALGEIEKHRESGDVLYDIYRAACVKEFELVLEQSGKLLRKRLAAYLRQQSAGGSSGLQGPLPPRCPRHGLMEPEAVERWLRYRDHRNDTAHNYGEDFAEATLKLLPVFVADAKTLAAMIEAADDG